MMFRDGVFDSTSVQDPKNPDNLPPTDGTHTNDRDQIGVHDLVLIVDQVGAVDPTIDTRRTEDEPHHLQPYTGGTN